MFQCAFEAGFWTSSKWSVVMRIDALWHVYTILFAHNLAAVHSERYFLVMLYREGKVQSSEGSVKEWFDRQHTNTSLLYREGFGDGRRRHAVSKCSGYLRKVLQRIPLCTFVSLAACRWRRGHLDPNTAKRHWRKRIQKDLAKQLGWSDYDNFIQENEQSAEVTFLSTKRRLVENFKNWRRRLPKSNNKGLTK